VEIAMTTLWLKAFSQTLRRSELSAIYRTRDEAKADIFNYIEFFYNPKRRHGTNERVSPIQFEETYFEKISIV